MQFLAWPGVVLILGLVVIFVFREPLERLLDRTQKIGKAGIETATMPGNQEASGELQTSAADEFLRLFDNALLVRREQWIRDQLETMLGSDQAERERILVRIIAAGSIVQQFETTYRLILGQPAWCS